LVPRKPGAVVTTIVAAVDQQSVATTEIAQNVQRAATGTQNISAHIGSVTQAASAAGAAAKNAMNAARPVSNQEAVLRDVVKQFLSGVRAA
jgi:methyl-accepting chemotaxis protein